MKKSLLILSAFLLLSACASWAQGVDVQGPPTCNGVASPLNCVFVSNVTAGNFLIAWVQVGLASSTIAVSDNINGSWTALGSPQNCSGGTACTGQMFYFPNAASGATTVTVTATGTVGTLHIDIEEFSGIATVSPLDTSSYTAGVNSTTQTTANLTDSNANDVVFAGQVNSGNSGTKSVAGPYVLTNGLATNRLALAWQNVSSTSVTGATFTFQFGNNAALVTASFKQAGGGGGGGSGANVIGTAKVIGTATVK